MFSDDRLSFYELQLTEGNLQLLCPKCHTFKTLRELDVLQGRRLRLASDQRPSSIDSPLPSPTPLHLGKNPSPSPASSPPLT